MDLSNDMISQFAKLTTEKKDEKKESTVYGSVKIYEGKTYVKIDGSDLLTPVETTTEVKDDERVTVLIKDHNAVITGNTSDPSAGMSTTDAIVADVGKFVNLTAENFQATNATIENLKVTKAEVADLTAANALIVNLDAVKANVQDLQATNAVVENLQADKASVKDLQATNAQIENLKATKAEIHDLEATNAQVQNLKADKADIEDLYAANATIQNLQATKADIVDLNALDAEINNMSANFATIQQLNVTNAEINTLDAEVAHIQTLVNGNLTSDNIASLNLTSANTTIQNAMIKDAMIDSVTASKLTAGIIDTDVITIQSNDGSMLMTGSVQQFKDENGKVRIQIGKDGGGNFTFVLYDETGKGVLIDEEGIKSSDALADGLIVDAKVAGNANISGSKLDIASVITEVNNDHTTTIKSNKIYLDEQGQSLEVAFNSLKTQVETIQDVTIDGDLSSVVNQVQSNTSMININKENISTLMAENVIREEEIKNLDGEIKEVNTTLSNKYSSLQQDLDGFETTVGQTYTTKSEFNNLSVGGENYIQNGGFKGAVAGDKIIPKWTFWGDTACKVYRNNQKNTYTRPNTLYLENKSGSEGGLSSQYIYKNEIAPDTTVTLSGYVEKELKVKGLKYGITYYDADGVTIASNYFDYEKAGEFSHTFTTPSSYESLRMSINHKGCTDGDTHYLVCIGELMLQKGNKATEWYPSSSDAEMTYATKSELTQTSDAITATFKTTGGYNLIQNSTGYGETRTWQCQGGNLSYYTYTDGTHGVVGVNRILLLTNTDNRTTEFFAYSSRFELKRGKTYTLSGYFYMNPTVKSWEVLLLMSKTISHTESSNLTYDTAKQVGGDGTIYNEWRYYQWTFTVPDNVISGYLRIDNNGYKSETGSTAASTVYWAALMLNEGSVALPWSPHPSECYTATTIIDSRGVRVNHSSINGHTRMQADGFYVNNGTEDVISINANGATFKGKVTVTSGSNVPTTVLSGTISSSQLNSSITSDISTAKTNASTALSTANTAKSTADSVNTTVNNNKTNWSNAYNRVVEWASGAVTGSVTIDGGKIKANTILTDRLAISDFTNYADLNVDTASKWGWTKVTYSNGIEWFKRNAIARDNPISRTYTCSGGETFRVKAEIDTSVYGNPQNDGSGTSTPLTASIMLIVLRSDGSRSYPASAGVTPTSTTTKYGSISSVITLPTNAIAFTVYIKVNGYSNFSGALYVRNVSVCKMSGGELIVDGAITASKIAAGTITGDKIAANTISGDKISGGILSATQEIKFVGGARIFGNEGETNAGLTISAGSYSFSGASQSFMNGNWDIGGKLIVSGTLSSGAITSSGTITGTTKVGTSNAYLSSGSIYVAPWAGNLNVAYVRLTTCGYIAGYNDANYFFLKSNGDVANIYAAAVVSNGNVVTSDARKKTDIRYVNADKQSKGDTGLMSPNTNITTKDMHDFMSTIPLASYRYIDDVRNNKDFTHYGFLTQDVLYTKVGSELVAMLYDDKQIGDENDFMGYSQDKFIMFLCGALQEEIKARKELEQKLKDYIGE